MGNCDSGGPYKLLMEWEEGMHIECLLEKPPHVGVRGPISKRGVSLLPGLVSICPAFLPAFGSGPKGPRGPVIKLVSSSHLSCTRCIVAFFFLKIK